MFDLISYVCCLVAGICAGSARGMQRHVVRLLASARGSGCRDEKGTLDVAPRKEILWSTAPCEAPPCYHWISYDITIAYRRKRDQTAHEEGSHGGDAP